MKMISNLVFLSLILSPLSWGIDDCKPNTVLYKMQNGETPKIKKLIATLKVYEPDLARIPHKVEFNEARSTLYIGEMDRKDRQVNRLMMGAFKEGSINTIDAGQVIGPKVVPIISEILEIAKKNDHNIEIRGEINFQEILKKFQEQSESPDVYLKTNPLYWTDAEIEKFHKAKHAGHFIKCMQVFLNKPCSFKYSLIDGKITFTYMEKKK